MSRSKPAGSPGAAPSFVPPRPTLANWDAPPWHRWAFQNMSEMFPTAPVRRGNGPAPLARAPRNLDDIAVTRADGSAARVRDIIAETHTDAWLVLHRGAVVSEAYFGEMTPATLHLSQSVSKSLVGALVGILVGRGLLDESAPVTQYVPELARGGYAGATLGHVLDMRTGVRFVEDYTDPDSEFALLDAAIGWKERASPQWPATTHELLSSIGSERGHGGHFQYRSIDNDVLGWICERVTGMRLAALLSREIWSKLGTEQDGNFTLDAAGTAVASGGMSACLRDYARFGQMFLDNGYGNGQQVVPVDWVQGCRQGDTEAFRPLYGDSLREHPQAAYRRQWWLLNQAQGVIAARGVFGQMIYLDYSHDMVAVKLSCWPTFLDETNKINTERAFAAIAEILG